MVYTPKNFTDYQVVTGSASAFKWPSKPTNLLQGSGIYPNHHTVTWLSQPQCSPPGEFVPRNHIVSVCILCFRQCRR